MIRSPKPATPIHRLAGMCGVQTAYKDAWGRIRYASLDSLRAALKVLGVDDRLLEDEPEAWRALRAERHRRLTDPVTVLRTGHPGEVVLRRPATERAVRIQCALRAEDGAWREWAVRWEELPAAQSSTRESDDGVDVRRLILPLALPSGYHRLDIRLGARHAQVVLLCAPDRCFGSGVGRGRHSWGLFAPLYALRSKADWGIGDYGHLREILDWVEMQGGRTVATLPLLATFLAESGDPSPYAPVSRRFWSELYIDLPALPEWGSDSGGEADAEAAGLSRRLRNLRRRDLVAYGDVQACKRRVLERLAQTFYARASRVRSADYRRFLRLYPDVESYARFRACTEMRRQGWPAWPSSLRGRRLPDSACPEVLTRYFMFAQFCAHRQLEALANRPGASSGLYLDFPVGVHAAGYDTWRSPSLFMPQASVGAPPDVAFTSGQDWGFPPVHPWAARREGYRYLRACVAAHMRYADWLRFDHVMGFHRLFVIPHGVSAADGVYVEYPHKEYYAVLAIESHRHRCRVVGENLGTVPPEVTPALHRRAASGLYVLAYEALGRPGRRLKPPLRRTVASLNTHDFVGFAGFWKGTDIRRRRQLGMTSAFGAQTERRQRDRIRGVLVRQLQASREGLRGVSVGLTDVLRGALRFLARSRAELVLVALEDLWLETEAQNLPASGARHPNWRRRFLRHTEQIVRSGRIRRLLADLTRWRSEARRPRA